MAILTPSLSTVVYDLQDLSAKHVLLAIITKLRELEEAERSKNIAPPTTEEQVEQNQENEDETAATTIREDIELAFGDLLLTLWKIAFKGDQVSAVLGLPVHESDKQRHIHQVSGLASLTQLPQTDQTTQPDMRDWASSMTKVAEAWQQDIAYKNKKEEISKDKKTSSFFYTLRPKLQNILHLKCRRMIILEKILTYHPSSLLVLIPKIILLILDVLHVFVEHF